MKRWAKLYCAYGAGFGVIHRTRERKLRQLTLTRIG